MNGDGRDDVLGSWPSGIFYKDTIGGNWVQMSSSPTDQIATGILDGDNKSDLIGTWSSGLWIKYSVSAIWEKLGSSPPKDIDAGIFR
jgi:hypothetical protein